MKEAEFTQLIKHDKFHIFVFSSPCPFPNSFAIHLWFVCVENGRISRWDVLYRKSLCKTSWEHLHLNALPPTQGEHKILFFDKKFFYKSKLIKHWQGDDDSLAKQICKFLKDVPEKYPYNKKYLPLGPNSNTFVRWVLGHFPEAKIRPSWRAIGFNYKNRF